MTNQGGLSTLQGVKYEIKAVLHEIPRLLRDEIKTIRYQPLSTALTSQSPPQKIYTDDYSYCDSVDNNFYCQAKTNKADRDWTIKNLIGRGVISQFYQQFKSLPNCKLNFVSNLPAQRLNNLTEFAKQAISLEEFKATFTQQRKSDFESLSGDLKIEDLSLWEFLKQISCIHLTEAMMDRIIFDYASNNYKDANKFVMSVTQFIENNPSVLIDKETIIRELQRNGLFELPKLKTEEIIKIFYQASSILRNYPSEIQGVHIKRNETNQLFKWAMKEDGDSISTLMDSAGTGKSVIMHDLLCKLEEVKIPVLGIKADFLSDLPDESDLLQALNTSDSLESLFSLVSKNNKAILLIDQLDALSHTFARNQKCLDIFLRLIYRISSIENVCVVLSCREFDKKYDPKLRQISSYECKINPLGKQQVQEVLNRVNVQWEQLTPKEQDLLINPQILSIYIEVISSLRKKGKKREPFESIQDLYNELWNIKISSSPSDINTESILFVINALVDVIQNTQLLSQPVSIFDHEPQALSYLQSVGILNVEQHKVSFFHQSFFDYCFSRSFSNKNISLSSMIFDSDQGFFIRPQMLQILTYLRSANKKKYIKELHSLLQIHNRRNGKFRYHLKKLLFEWFGQQINITSEELSLSEVFLQNDDYRVLFLAGANGNSEWYQIIEKHKEYLFSLPHKEIDYVVNYLISIEDNVGEPVFKLFRTRLGVSEKWDFRIKRALDSYIKWDSKTASEYLIYLCKHIPDPWNSFRLLFHHLIPKDVSLACDAFEILLNGSYDEWLKIDFDSETQNKNEDIDTEGDDDNEIINYYKKTRLLDKHVEKLIPNDVHWIHDLCNKGSETCPDRLLGILIPWLEKCLPNMAGEYQDGKFINVVFEWSLIDTSHGTQAHIYDGIKNSLRTLAEKDRNKFLAYANRIKKCKILVLHQILISVLLQHSEKYASWICDYFLKDEARLTINDFGLRRNLSVKLVSKIFPVLDAFKRNRLEQEILKYIPEYERRIEGLSYRGYSQYQFLFHLPDKLLSTEGVKAKRELARKFPNYQPREYPIRAVEAVGSPIPPEKCKVLSDDDWLQAMRHFDDNTGWGKPREKFGTGGVVELSRTFKEVVKESPKRFIRLASKFDDSVSSQYYSELIYGLEESGIDSETFFNVCEDVVKQRGDDERIQRAICFILRRRAKDNVSNNLLNYLKNIALSSSDPKSELWKKEACGKQQYYGGDPHDHGINSVRGNAVEEFFVCFEGSNSFDKDELLTFFERASLDPISSVRACLMNVLKYALRYDRERIVNTFENAVEGRKELQTHRVSQEFIYYALYSHARSMLKFIKVMEKDDDEKVREAGGRLITLASFQEYESLLILMRHLQISLRKLLLSNANLRLFFKVILSCLLHSILRCFTKRDISFIKGIAQVYATNISSNELFNECIYGLKKLCRLEDTQLLDEISNCFNKLTLPNRKIKAFISVFLKTEHSTRPGKNILQYALTVCSTNPEYALFLAERIFARFCSKEVIPNEYYWEIDDDMINLIIAIYNLSGHDELRVRIMNLFDRVMEVGSYKATELLKSVDR